MIKTEFFFIMLITFMLGFSSCREGTPENWDVAKIDRWFSKAEFLNGWDAVPDISIDRRAFAVSYFRNKERWDKAFSFLHSADLATLAPGRHDIDGDNLYASVSDYLTKDESAAGFEAHRKYADIQYVVKGMEIIQITPIANRDSVMQDYDESRDIEFFTVKEHKTLEAVPGRFFIFFPSDAHKPGLKIDLPDSVRKVVVKVRLD